MPAPIHLSSISRIFFLVGVAFLGQRFCRAQDVPERFGPAEEYVLHELESGEEVDLDRPFPKKTDQTLNPIFLEKLLAGNFKDATLERRGIKIHHAVFDQPVYVSHVTVPYEVWLNDCTFLKEVDFGGSHFEKDFSLERSRFETPPGQAAGSVSLISMVVAGDLVLRGAHFESTVDVTGSSIGGRLIGDDAEFMNPEMSADLEDVRVDDGVLLRKAKFQGPVSVANGVVRDLYLERAQGKMMELDLSQAEIKRALRIAQTLVQNLNAASMSAKGSVVLQDLVVSDKLVLKHVDVHALELLGVKPPSVASNFQIDGMSFEHVTTGESGNSWQELYKFVDASEFNSQSYLQLEAYFRAQGYADRANSVYIAMRRKERRQFLSIWSTAYWLSLTLDGLVRYGRAPGWALVYSLAVVGLGVLVFWKRENMEPQKTEDADKPYSPFWYSVDLLTPFIDLQSANVWMPNKTWRAGTEYARVHRVAGWILVPIGIAAISGLIK
jgi:hypothetical protein